MTRTYFVHPNKLAVRLRVVSISSMIFTESLDSSFDYDCQRDQKSLWENLNNGTKQNRLYARLWIDLDNRGMSTKEMEHFTVQRSTFPCLTLCKENTNAQRYSWTFNFH